MSSLRYSAHSGCTHIARAASAALSRLNTAIKHAGERSLMQVASLSADTPGACSGPCSMLARGWPAGRDLVKAAAEVEVAFI